MTSEERRAMIAGWADDEPAETGANDAAEGLTGSIVEAAPETQKQSDQQKPEEETKNEKV